jgi:Mrp family chromosome partitioning ATPase
MDARVGDLTLSAVPPEIGRLAHRLLTFGHGRHDGCMIGLMSARAADGVGALAHHIFNHWQRTSHHSSVLLDASMAGQGVPVTVHETAPTGQGLDTGWFSAPNRSALFSRTVHAPQFWRDIRHVYAAGVMALPALDETGEGLRIAPHLDGIVLVVVAEETPRAVANHLRTTLVHAGAQVLGVVLTEAVRHIPPTIYRHL